MKLFLMLLVALAVAIPSVYADTYHDFDYYPVASALVEDAEIEYLIDIYRFGHRVVYYEFQVVQLNGTWSVASNYSLYDHKIDIYDDTGRKVYSAGETDGGEHRANTIQVAECLRDCPDTFTSAFFNDGVYFIHLYPYGDVRQEAIFEVTYTTDFGLHPLEINTRNDDFRDGVTLHMLDEIYQAQQLLIDWVTTMQTEHSHQSTIITEQAEQIENLQFNNTKLEERINILEEQNISFENQLGFVTVELSKLLSDSE